MPASPTSTKSGASPWRAWGDIKCPAVQPQIIILNLRRQMRREGEFDARAGQQTAVAVTVRAEVHRSACHRIDQSHVLAEGPSTAGFAVDEPVTICHPKSSRPGTDPSVFRNDLNRSNAWNNDSIVVVLEDGDVPFNSDNENAVLVVESELTSEDGYPVGTKAQVEETVSESILTPGPTYVGATVESSPTKRCRHERGRRISWSFRANVG